jgi:hypothetical protein
MKKILLPVSLAFLLSGCVTLAEQRQQWLMENCNPQAAYTNGLSDGLRPDAMPDNYGNSCVSNQASIGGSYLKGFTTGLQSRPKQINVNQTIANTNTEKSN